MMYVEDLLLGIRARLYQPTAFDGLLDDAWHRSFIPSVGDTIDAGRPLSTNQGRAVLNVIRRVRRPLVHYGMATDDDIDEMLCHPQYRQALYESSYLPREARYLGDNLLGLRFKQQATIIERIKALGKPMHTEWARSREMAVKPQFDWDYRLWMVPVMRYNVRDLCTLLNEFRFNLDAPTIEYLRLARQSLDKPSAVARMQDTLVVRICDNPIFAGWVTEVADGLVL